MTYIYILIISDKILSFFVVVIVLSSVVSSLTPSTYLTVSDQARLKKVLSSVFPLTDLTTAYYGVLGYSLIKEKFPTSEVYILLPI